MNEKDMNYDDERTMLIKNTSVVSKEPITNVNCSIITVFDGNKPPYTVDLNAFGKTTVSFGREAVNGKEGVKSFDLSLESKVVSYKGGKGHGRFVLKGNKWYIEDIWNSDDSNGLLLNNRYISSHAIQDGELIRIDSVDEKIKQGVLFVCSTIDSENVWDTYEIKEENKIAIGRSSECDICLPYIGISKLHAIISNEGGKWYIENARSTDKIVVNNESLIGKQRLYEKDEICISNVKLIFTSKLISHCCYAKGISVDGTNLIIRRNTKENHKKISKVVTDNVNLSIKPGEMVAIIGGSGAGKSTILNCLCGYLKPDEGEVYINGVDLYKNYDSLKKMIGYVPQSDIVYDNLTLYDMLEYTAKLRLPMDVSEEEKEEAINNAIEIVGLSDKKNAFIKRLSGGQKKRASIAVELLSKPNLLFLDEPASGLDPGTERSLMLSLREMADSGKTVILVTHSTLQLEMCDKVVFMGKDGRLCFFGALKDALDFFGVDDVVEIYNQISDESLKWKKTYEELNVVATIRKKDVSQEAKRKRAKNNVFKQLSVFCLRYMKLIINDRQRLLLLLLQAPLLAFMISIVANGKQFEQYEATNGMLFSLSCSAFWVGMLNAIQEICKERNIIKREYMAGASLSAYAISKIIVLGLLCLIQSLLIVVVFVVLVGSPQEGLMMGAFLELLITTFLTSLASAALGLFVSALFGNPDRAMTVAPILLMPQILFSGMIFKLSGVTKKISWFAICKWSMEAYGTTANLNSLPLKLQVEGFPIEHVAEDFYEYTNEHMLITWGILFLFSMVCMFMVRFALIKLRKDR